MGQQEHLYVPNLATLNQKVLPNLLGIRKESLCLLCVPKVFPPLRGCVCFPCMRPYRLEALLEPVLAEGSPTSNIDATCLPGCYFWPPRKVGPLVTLSCSRISTIQFIKRKPTNRSIPHTLQLSKTIRPHQVDGTSEYPGLFTPRRFGQDTFPALLLWSPQSRAPPGQPAKRYPPKIMRLRERMDA